MKIVRKGNRPKFPWMAVLELILKAIPVAYIVCEHIWK